MGSNKHLKGIERYKEMEWEEVERIEIEEIEESFEHDSNFGSSSSSETWDQVSSVCGSIETWSIVSDSHSVISFDSSVSDGKKVAEKKRNNRKKNNSNKSNTVGAQDQYVPQLQKSVHQVAMKERKDSFMEVQKRSVVHSKIPQNSFLREKIQNNQKVRYSSWRGSGSSVGESKKYFLFFLFLKLLFFCLFVCLLVTNHSILN